MISSFQITDARPDTGGLSGATPIGSGYLGQDRPGSTTRHGRLLLQFDYRLADYYQLRPDNRRTASTFGGSMMIGAMQCMTPYKVLARQ
jgi:hypothetical protein